MPFAPTSATPCLHGVDNQKKLIMFVGPLFRTVVMMKIEREAHTIPRVILVVVVIVVVVQAHFQPQLQFFSNYTHGVLVAESDLDYHDPSYWCNPWSGHKVICRNFFLVEILCKSNCPLQILSHALPLKFSPAPHSNYRKTKPKKAHYNHRNDSQLHLVSRLGK